MKEEIFSWLAGLYAALVTICIAENQWVPVGAAFMVAYMIVSENIGAGDDEFDQIYFIMIATVLVTDIVALFEGVYWVIPIGVLVINKILNRWR